MTPQWVRDTHDHQRRTFGSGNGRIEQGFEVLELKRRMEQLERMVAAQAHIIAASKQFITALGDIAVAAERAANVIRRQFVVPRSVMLTNEEARRGGFLPAEERE